MVATAILVAGSVSEKAIAACDCTCECLGSVGEWSGRWESNPRLKLGKLGYYHYTTPATRRF